MEKLPVRLVNVSDEDEFETQCKDLVNEGYILHHCACGFVNSDEYDFANVFQAVFVLKEHSK